MEINEDDVIRMLLGLPKGKRVEHPLWTEEEGSQPEIFVHHLRQGRRHGHDLLDAAGETCKCLQSIQGCSDSLCRLSAISVTSWRSPTAVRAMERPSGKAESLFPPDAAPLPQLPPAWRHRP